MKWAEIHCVGRRCSGHRPRRGCLAPNANTHTGIWAALTQQRRPDVGN